MLNPFPIQFLALLAYFLLRVFVGVILVYFGWTHLQNRELIIKKGGFPFFKHTLLAGMIFATSELLIGTMFILGYYTQIAALLTAILSLKLIIFHSKFSPKLIQGKIFYVLLFACSLSLFITGAGAFAFDLPI